MLLVEEKDCLEQTTTTRCEKCWDRGRYLGLEEAGGDRGSHGKAGEARGERWMLLGKGGVWKEKGS